VGVGVVEAKGGDIVCCYDVTQQTLIWVFVEWRIVRVVKDRHVQGYQIR
jgi:hypothetical protein